MTAHKGLRARVEKAKENLHIDVPVQRVDPPIIVRFRPTTQEETERLNKQSKNDKRDDATVRLHARFLAKLCIGIWALDAKGNAVTLDENEDPVDVDSDELPTFQNGVIAELLGTSDSESTVRALYATDGDVISTSLEVQAWSGLQAEAVEDEARAELQEGQ